MFCANAFVICVDNGGGLNFHDCCCCSSSSSIYGTLCNGQNASFLFFPVNFFQTESKLPAIENQQRTSVNNGVYGSDVCAYQTKFPVRVAIMPRSSIPTSFQSVLHVRTVEKEKRSTKNQRARIISAKKNDINRPGPPRTCTNDLSFRRFCFCTGKRQ